MEIYFFRIFKEKLKNSILNRLISKKKKILSANSLAVLQVVLDQLEPELHRGQRGAIEADNQCHCRLDEPGATGGQFAEILGFLFLKKT